MSKPSTKINPGPCFKEAEDSRTCMEGEFCLFVHVFDLKMILGKTQMA
jgi:hypothetical protein